MRGGGARHDQHIAETRVVSLLMKMGAVFLKRAPQHLGQFSLSMIFSRKGGL
jgi:hypothetical protein